MSSGHFHVHGPHDHAVEHVDSHADPFAGRIAVMTAIFATIGAPVWFSRDADGFTDPLLPSGFLGLVTALIVPTQLLLIAFSLRGFSQQWNVEVEHYPAEEPDYVPLGV